MAIDRRLEVGEAGAGNGAIVVVNEVNVRTDYRPLYIATATHPVNSVGKSWSTPATRVAPEFRRLRFRTHTEDKLPWSKRLVEIYLRERINFHV